MVIYNTSVLYWINCGKPGNQKNWNTPWLILVSRGTLAFMILIELKKFFIDYASATQQLLI